MKQFFGGLMLAIGILMMTGSGLCTLAIIIFGAGGMSFSEAISMLPLPLIVGGIPFALGTGLFFIGRNLLREK